MIATIQEGIRIQASIADTMDHEARPRPASAEADAAAGTPVDDGTAGPSREDRGLKAAEALLADLTSPEVGVTFRMLEGVDEPVIRVVNRRTGEVVRQIPADEVLEMKKRFGELLGMFKDLKA